MIATVRRWTGWNGFTKRERVSVSSSTLICGRRLTVVLLVGLSGCTVHPPGEFEERATAVQMGKPFEKPIEVRQIPPLPANPTSDQLVEYALLSNAELEQHYWEWQSR